MGKKAVTAQPHAIGCDCESGIKTSNKNGHQEHLCHIKAIKIIAICAVEQEASIWCKTQEIFNCTSQQW